MDQYVKHLHDRLPPENHPIFKQNFSDQKKSGWIGFLIALFLGNFGIHMLYFRNGWGCFSYIMISIGVVILFDPFYETLLIIIVWVVSMFHGALGAGAVNRKIADSIYATLK